MNQMNIGFYLAHPSQYYVMKNAMNKLQAENHTIYTFIKSKDILEKIVFAEGRDYINLLPQARSKKFLSFFTDSLTRNYRLYKWLVKLNVDILVSAASDSSQASFIKGIPSIILNDDDASVIRKSALYGWPFSSVILAPESCNMGYWRKKTVFYKGFQKLCYLHPNYFKPDKETISKYIDPEETYFIIRSVSLTAHHDKNIRGLSNELLGKLIERIESYGKVYLFSEGEMPEMFRKYHLKINPLDIHHFISFADLVVSDGQSMIQEAAILGTPSIRFNDFVGRIGVMEELENKYGLTIGISPDFPDLLLHKAEEIASQKDTSCFKKTARRMIDEMIDPTKLLLWTINNHHRLKTLPKCVRIDFERDV